MNEHEFSILELREYAGKPPAKQVRQNLGLLQSMRANLFNDLLMNPELVKDDAKRICREADLKNEVKTSSLRIAANLTLQFGDKLAEKAYEAINQDDSARFVFLCDVSVGIITPMRVLLTAEDTIRNGSFQVIEEIVEESGGETDFEEYMWLTSHISRNAELLKKDPSGQSILQEYWQEVTGKGKRKPFFTEVENERYVTAGSDLSWSLYTFYKNRV